MPVASGTPIMAAVPQSENAGHLQGYRSTTKLKGDARPRYAELAKRLAEFDAIKPAPRSVAQGMIDVPLSARRRLYCVAAGTMHHRKKSSRVF